MTVRIIIAWLLVLLACCLLPADERVELDREVGRAEAPELSVAVADGLAAVRAISAERIELWAQAPSLDVEVVRHGAPASLRLDVLNCAPGSLLSLQGGEVFKATPVDGRAASCRFELGAVGSVRGRIAPADLDARAPFVFAVLSDVQRGIGGVHEIFERMSADPELRFVVSTGDLVNTGARAELVRFQHELTALAIPLYATVGNHEMGADPRHWHQLFGPFNVHFRFHGVAFSLVDSGNATIDPHVYDALDEWLTGAREDVHVALTHVPPLDPVGLRGGAFRSRKEAAKLLKKLARGRVDALFLGHIHSYYAFSAAGIPIHLSGGGGAIEERLDGIGRHYLRVHATPGARIEEVGLVRVD